MCCSCPVLGIYITHAGLPTIARYMPLVGVVGWRWNGDRERRKGRGREREYYICRIPNNSLEHVLAAGRERKWGLGYK